MTREEVYADCVQAEKEATVTRKKIIVEVAYSGVQGFEYEDCTLEEAIYSAKQDFWSEYAGMLDNVQIDEVTEV